MEPKKLLVTSRKEWRTWLAKNHSKETKVFLMRYKKHTGKPTVSHREAMEEAICFGWIDTTVKRVDEDLYGHTFVKRTKNSRWSNNTLGYARQLIAEKKMMPSGLAMYQLGLQKPTIDRGLSKNPRTPSDLLAALSKNKKAHKNWNNLARSYRRQYIYWIVDAKRPETRARRIKTVVACLKDGKKLRS